jgi:hypothetical protein
METGKEEIKLFVDDIIYQKSILQQLLMELVRDETAEYKAKVQKSNASQHMGNEHMEFKRKIIPLILAA